MSISAQMPGKQGISGSTLKIIAIITMIIDHIGATLVSGQITKLVTEQNLTYNQFAAEHYHLLIANYILRGIGRIAFPIFCFLLIEGFLHTRNNKIYALRLGLFALISEIPFDLALTGKLVDWSRQNVFFTLFLGLMMVQFMCIIDELYSSKPTIRLLLTIFILLIGAGLALLLHTDYDCFGVFVIVIMYKLRKNKFMEMMSGCICLLVMAINEIPCIIGLIPVKLYNGQRGLNMKYIFYIFYPAHLLILYLICRYMGIYG